MGSIHSRADIYVKHIYDKDFKYSHSSNTDLKATFARVRERQKEEAEVKVKKVSEIKPKIKARV